MTRGVRRRDLLALAAGAAAASRARADGAGRGAAPPASAASTDGTRGGPAHDVGAEPVADAPADNLRAERAADAPADDADPWPGPERELAAGVRVLVGSRDVARPDNGGAVGNLGFIDTPAGAVVIDTGSSWRRGCALIAMAQRRTGRVPVAAVVTQARPEYVMGMAAFAERGIEIVAHEATARLIARRCPECLRRLQHDLGEAAMRGTRLVAPTRTVAATTRIAPGGRRIELLHLGPAHTAGDLVVVDVETGIAFAGALVPEGRVPELEDPGGAGPWRAALAALAARPLRLLVPGYGEPGAPAELVGATDAYLADLMARVQSQWDRGVDLLTAQREITGERWKHWAQHDALHARNVQREYLAAEARWLSGK